MNFSIFVAKIEKNETSRREQDSNLRTGFAGYTLSRRASSTTRAPLLNFAAAKLQTKMKNEE